MTSNAGIVDRQCKRSCDRFSLFDQKIAVEKLTGLTLLAESIGATNPVSTVSPIPSEPVYSNYISAQDRFICTLCGVDLLDGPAMRKHFRTEWHLYNMNRYRKNQPAVSQSDFNLLNTTEVKPVQSDALDTTATSDQLDLTSSQPMLSASSHKQMIYFRNKCGEIIGLHRCILFTQKCLPNTLDELLSRIARVRQSRRWAVLLYSGGKFAGGIFDGNNEVVHKTLQHYTVRAKQGGSQASFDASNTGGMGGGKSAGASLRRHGEMAIRSDISNLLHNRWRTHLQACQFIFLWSPKVHRGIFFNPPDKSLDVSEPSAPSSGKDSSSTPVPDPLATVACQAKLGMTPDDPRIHRIPCRITHITYAQIKEIHKEISTFDVYDEHANLNFLALSERKQLRHLSESGDETLVQTRSGRFILAPLQLLASRDSRSLSSPSEQSDLEQNSTASNDLSATEDLSESLEQSFSLAERQQPSVNEAPTESTTDDQRKSFEDLFAPYHGWHRRLRVAVASGDYSVVQGLLPPVHLVVEESESSKDAVTIHSPQSPSGSRRFSTSNGSIPPADICLRLLNHSLAEGRTLLHVAVEFQSDPNLLNLLLESGCDPALLDAEGTSPYTLAARLRKKTLMNVFRRFRFSHPDRYDYQKAQIPTPLDPVKEAAKAEKERERLRKQRQRLKEKKAAERIQQEKLKEEEAERQRFAALSDREKRALVAERRLLASNSVESGTVQKQVFNRCFQCACDISGKVPFTYLDYNFCTPSCLRAHRLGTIAK